MDRSGDMPRRGSTGISVRSTARSTTSRAARRDPLCAFMKARGGSSYHAMGYFVVRAANGVPAFRMRIREGRPRCTSGSTPSFTEPRADGELFKCVGVEWCEDLGEFLRRCGEASARQGDRFLLDSEEARDDYLYLSCLPWVDFTSVSQAGSFDRDDAVPHITWGKYAREGGRVTMPLSVTAHHAFCDGIHVGRFFDALQRMLDAL
ncbi:MAG: CatA-like O-acetyltransferase [Anaerotruncus massiliensis (ex Togo et al. 2019)]